MAIGELESGVGALAAGLNKGKEAATADFEQAKRKEQLKKQYTSLPPEDRKQIAGYAQVFLAQESKGYLSDYNRMGTDFNNEYGAGGYKAADSASEYASRVRSESDDLLYRGSRYSDLMDIFGADMDQDFVKEYGQMLSDTRGGLTSLRSAADHNQEYYAQFADEDAYNLYQYYSENPDEPLYVNGRGEIVDPNKDPKWRINKEYGDAVNALEQAEMEKTTYEGTHDLTIYKEGELAALQREAQEYETKSGYNDDPETRKKKIEDYDARIAELEAIYADPKTAAEREKEYGAWLEEQQAEYDAAIAEYDKQIAAAQAVVDELEPEYKEAMEPVNDARRGLNWALVKQRGLDLLYADIPQFYRWGKNVIRAAQGEKVESMFTDNSYQFAQDAAQAYYDEGGDPNASVYTAGVIGIAAPVTDVVGYVGEVAGTMGEELGFSNAEQVKEGSAKIRDTAAELQAIGNQMTEDRKAGRGRAGRALVDVGVQAVPVAFDAALNIATDGAAGMISLAARSFGSGTMEARQGGGNLAQQFAYGAGSAAVEVLTEKMFDFAGGKIYGASATDDIINHWVGHSFKTRAGRAAAKLVVEAAGEGVEEVVSDIVNPLLKSIYNGRSVADNYSDLEFDDIAYDFIIGAALGALGGTVNTVSEMAGNITEREAFFMQAGAEGIDFYNAMATWEQMKLSDVKSLSEKGSENYLQAEQYERRLQTGQRVKEKLIDDLRQRTVDSVSDADISNTINAVQGRLAELGINDPALAHAISVAALAPEVERVGAKELTLTKEQRQLIKNNPVAQQVLAEMNVNALRTEQIRQIFGAETDGTMDNSWAKTGIRGNRLLASDVYGTERAVSSPEIGKATVNGEDVQIVGVQDGKIRIKQGEDVSSVAVKDISNISEDYHTLLEAAASREDGDTMLRAYRPGQIISSYVQAWTLASELYGANTSLTPAQARDMYPSLFRTLTDTQLELAMKSGAKAAAAKTEKRKAEIKEAKGKASEEAETKGEVKRKKGTVSYDGGKVNGKTVKGVDKSKFTRQQKAISAMVETLADVVNIDYVFFDGDPNTGGAYTQGGKIYLNINSGLLANKALGAATLSHEITHFLQDYAPEEYNELKDFITSEILKESPEEFNKLVERQLALEPNLSFTDAVNEVVANACQKMLLNSKAITELARQNMKLAEKIADVIEDISGKIKAAFADVDINDNIGVYAPARAIEGFVDEVQKRWDRALKAAVENYNAEQTTSKKNTAENGGVQFMITGITGASGTNYGVGVVLDSTLLDNLTEAERIEMVRAYIESVEGGSFVAYDSSGNPVNVKVEETKKKFTNKSGRRVSVNKDLLFKNNKRATKQESIVLIDELLSVAKHQGQTAARHPHGWLDNNGLNPWDQWKAIIQDKSGAVWEATLQIANTTSGEKVLYDIDPIKKVERASSLATTSTTNSKPQTTELVKNPNVKYVPGHQFQMFDSSGKEMTDGQQEYFADSKIRDREGRLKVMYRGGASDITVFDRRKSSYSNLYGRGFYFTDSESHASQYGKAHPYYLDITNPLQAGAKTFTDKQIRAFLEAVAEDEDYGLENYGYGATVSSVLKGLKGKDDFGVLSDINATCIGDLVAASELFNEVNGTSIDGIVTPTETVAFRSDQIKEIDNENPTKNPDTRFQKFSADELQDKYDSYIDAGKELTDVRNQIRTWKNTADFKRIMDDIGKAKGDAIQDAINAYKEWEDASGFGALYEREKELSARYDSLRKEYEAMSLENEKEIERKQMEKSGKSEGDFFRDKAVKEFGYTPYYYDAGYIVPNGKMLNFSGEKGKHYGSRGQDHRAIGTIFASDISGSEAMLKFMEQGNIRIMAETPGIDINSKAEPTKEQYAQIRKFAAAYAKEEFFGVDFTDERGNTIGSLEYDGRVRPDRVINDIKHFYETGEVRDQGISQFYQKWGIGETEAEQQARAESISNLKAENKILRERADYWKAQTRVSKEHLINRKDTDRLANALLKEYTSRADKDSVKEKLKALGDWLVQNKDISYDELYEKAREIADDITSESYGVIDDSNTEQLSMLKDFLKSTPLNLSAEDFRDTGDEDFRRRYGRYFTVRKNGRGIDSAWGELADMFGEGLFPEDTYAPGDMLNMIGDYLDLWKPRYGNPLETYGDEILDYATNQIIEAMLSTDIREAPKTFADKALEKLWRQQAKDKAKLDALREQKNARIEQLKREAAEKNRQIRIAEKAAKYKAVSKVKQHYQDMLQRQRDTRNENAGQAKYRDQVAEKAARLNKMLMTNSDKLHVPEVLKKPLAEFLSSIDFSSKSLLTKGAETKADAKFQAALTALSDILLKQERYLNGEETAEDALGGYLDLSQESMDYLRTTTEEIHKMLQTGETYTVNAMNAEQLKGLSKLLTNISSAIRNMNSFMANARYETVKEAANADISYMESLGKASAIEQSGISKALAWESGTPYYVLKRFGEGGKAVFDSLSRGWEKMAFNVKKVIDFTEKTYTDKEVKSWKRELHEIELEDGSQIKMTTAQIMALSQLINREQAMKHIAKGGIRIGNIKGKVGSIVDTKHYHLTFNDLSAIVGELTPRQAAVAEAMQRFMARQGANWGNEVSMRRFGYNFYDEGDAYYPIRTDSNDRGMQDTEAMQNSMFRLLNLSASKSLNPKASNALIVEDIFDTFADHMADMAKLNGMGLPILDAIKWFNYKERIDLGDGEYDTRTLQGAMEQAFGDQAQRYFRTLMKDINGMTEAGDRGTGLLAAFMGNYKAAAVAANLRVAFLQPTSYVRAAALVNPKYLAMAFTSKNAYKEALENSGTAMWKSLGYYDTNISRGMREQIEHNDSWKDKIVEASMTLAELGDKVTWGRLWVACKMQTKAQNPGLEGEALTKATADLFRETVYATQVMDSTLTRSELMRGKTLYSKAMTAFMAEPTLSYNLLMDAASDFHLDSRRYGKAEAWKRNSGKLGNAFAVYVASAAFAAMVESLFDAIRDDDNDEFWEKYLEALLGEGITARIKGEKTTEGILKSLMSGNLMQDLTIIGKLPYVKSMYSTLQGYKSKDMTSAAFDAVIDSVKIWRETAQLANGTLEKPTKVTYYGNMTTWGKVYKSLQALSQLSGIGVANLTRDALALWNTTVGSVRPDWKIKTYQTSAERKFLDEVYPHGVSWAQYQDAVTATNEDGEGKVKQDELGPYLKGEIDAGRMTPEQADAIWSAQGWKKTLEEWLGQNS